MRDGERLSLEQIRAFLEGSEEVEFAARNQSEVDSISCQLRPGSSGAGRVACREWNHEPGDGIHGRLLEADMESSRRPIRVDAGQHAAHQDRARTQHGHERLRVDRGITAARSAAGSFVPREHLRELRDLAVKNVQRNRASRG